jgi:multisubunit Na+/H+ antiporter MnhE subunit
MGKAKPWFWAAWWAVAFGLWLLLVFKTELAEVVLGAVAAALAATAAELVRQSAYAPFIPELRWWRGLLRLPREVAVDTWRMSVLLVRHFVRGEPIHGRFRVVHFETEGPDDRHAQSRRAAAKWLGCVSPNTYVIGFDEKRNLAVVHQLVPGDLPPDLDPSC